MTLDPVQCLGLAWATLALAGAELLAPMLMPLMVVAVLACALHPAVNALAPRKVPGAVERVWSVAAPRLHHGVQRFIDECDGMFGHYLRGLLMVIAALSAYCSAALPADGFELVLPVSALLLVALRRARDANLGSRLILG